MFTKVEECPTTPSSRMFDPASHHVDLAGSGFDEHEYFVTGTSNVYAWDGTNVAVRNSDVPYVNRVVVRAPKDPARFSGNVIVEILNSTSNFDVDRVWALTHPLLMRQGDAYVGITSKPNVLRALKAFDSERYAPLTWALDDPDSENIPEEKLGNFAGASFHGSEDGLFWDMLADLAEALRKPGNPFLPNLQPAFQYLAGWSQSGGYMIRWLKTFAYRSEREAPYFDGYFSCGSTSCLMPDLNQGYGPTGQTADATLPYLPQPMVEIHTESENLKWHNYASILPDSNIPGRRYRVYGIAGSTHDSQNTWPGWYAGDSDSKRIGVLSTYPGQENKPNDFPYELAFRAALKALYAWVREGKVPESQEPIRADLLHENLPDETGNSQGGWRLPPIEVPLAAYRPVCAANAESTPIAASLFGYVENYPLDLAKTLYRSYEHYLELVEESIRKCVRKGLLLTEDADECRAYCKALAAEIGLAPEGEVA